ncbi:MULTISPECIES: tripartite tricarboxylate transporter TctB family protein [Thermocrispum]|uniref:Tripartite tricarboxylate transporter TctB family protein n=1 Tax=Thermocrispum agreste TaxID=37925 RepID=A0ABD6FG68_9PSEU|nr:MULTISPECIES: tripartite tricarboxylate transporter TctB family protein [Thermocrispum]
MSRWLGEHSELGVAGFLALLGVLVIADAAMLPPAVGQVGPIGPDVVPYAIGGLLVVTAVILAVDVLRGGHGEAESGEDVDLSEPPEWRTVLLLAAAFAANIVLIDSAGFLVSGTVLFWGSAYALGSRKPVRDGLIAVGLTVATYFLFAHWLGVPLPLGPFEGVL